MNVIEIIERARRLSYISEEEYTDVMGIDDLNSVYHDLVSSIISKVGEEYFFEEFTTDLVANQNEYTFESASSTQDGMNKIDNLFIKYNEEDNYKQVKYFENEFSLNNNRDFPIYNIAQNSIFIYPASDKNVTDGLKARVSILPKDLEIDNTENDIRIMRNYHNILVSGLISYTYRQRGLLNEANNFLSLYEKQKQDLILQLSDRNSSPLEVFAPNLSNFE